MISLPTFPDLYLYRYTATIEGVAYGFRWRWIEGEGWYWTLYNPDGNPIAHRRLSPNTAIRVSQGPPGLFLGFGAADPYPRTALGEDLNLIFVPDAEIPTFAANNDWIVVP